MVTKSNIYIINGNDLLIAILDRDIDKWNKEIKLLKDLDKILNYTFRYLELYFRVNEPASKAIILIDKPIRQYSRSSSITINYIPNLNFAEEIKYEIRPFSRKHSIYLVSNKNYSNQINTFSELKYISSRDFLNNIIRNVNSTLTPSERQRVSDGIHYPESYTAPTELIITKLRNPNISLTASDIHYELDMVRDSIFALHFVGKNFPLISAAQYVDVRSIIYIGYTARGGALNKLISDNSSRSNIRQLIGAILLDTEQKKYEIFNISNNDFKFDEKSEWIITDWIKSNIKVSLVADVKKMYELPPYGYNVNNLKNDIIRELSPVLNLSNNPGNAYVFELRQLIKNLSKSQATYESRELSEPSKILLTRRSTTSENLEDNLSKVDFMLRDFDNLEYYNQRDILRLMDSFPNINKIFQYYYSTETKSKERDRLDFIYEKEEKVAREEWERIIDEMAHSINTDVYAAISYLNRYSDDSQIEKASNNVKQIRDLTNLIMWYLKRNKLKLSGSLQTINIESVISNQVETIKAGVHTLRLTTSQHRDKILSMPVNIIKNGQTHIRIDKDLVSAIDLLFKDILRNALKNTDETEPVVSIFINGDDDFVKVDISNNVIISEKELDWFNHDIEDDDLQMSKSSKVGLRLVKKWSRYLGIENKISIDKKKKETVFHLKLPREIKVEESA